MLWGFKFASAVNDSFHAWTCVAQRRFMQFSGHTFWFEWMNCMRHCMYVGGQHNSWMLELPFFVVQRISYTLLDASWMIGFLFWKSTQIMSVTVVCYLMCRLSQNRIVWNVIYLRATNYFWAKPGDVEHVIIQVQWTRGVWSSVC
jgi:hypothetical protein